MRRVSYYCPLGLGGGRLKPLGARSSGVEKGAKNEQNRQKPAGGACRKPSSGTACYDQTFEFALAIGRQWPQLRPRWMFTMWNPRLCGAQIRVQYVYYIYMPICKIIITIQRNNNKKIA